MSVAVNYVNLLQGPSSQLSSTAPQLQEAGMSVAVTYVNFILNLFSITIERISGGGDECCSELCKTYYKAQVPN